MRPYQAAVNRSKIGHARLRHRHHEFCLKNFEHTLYTRRPVGSKAPTDRAAKTDGFGAQGEGHLRFGYAITLEEIEGCVEALRRFFS